MSRTTEYVNSFQVRGPDEQRTYHRQTSYLCACPMQGKFSRHDSEIPDGAEVSEQYQPQHNDSNEHLQCHGHGQFAFLYACLDSSEMSLCPSPLSKHCVFTARCTIVQSAVLRLHVVCPSVCDVGGSGAHRLEILETNCTDNYPNTFALPSPKSSHKYTICIHQINDYQHLFSGLR